MRYLSILLASLVLFSCTKEVKIDIPGFREDLVIDGRIETGQPAIVLLSTSANIYAPTNLEAYINGFISDATVIISDGVNTDTLVTLCTNNLPPGTEEFAAGFFGIPVEQITQLNLCAYISTGIVGEVGKTYTLKVIHNGKTYNSTTSILQPVALDSLFWKPEPVSQDWGFTWAILSDPPTPGDAYGWEVKYLGDFGFQKPFGPFTNDKFYNGLTFDFAYGNPMSWGNENIEEKYWGLFKKGDTVIVKFSKIGQREYTFFEKKYNQLYTGGNPFATPTNIPTNITGGALGVWVGYSPWFDTLICN
jgi:hypothetical protein